MPRTRKPPPVRFKQPLSIRLILSWVDCHRDRHGRWPNHLSGKIKDSPDGTTWLGVDTALSKGGRSLPGGSSLARVLYLHRGVRSPGNVPPLNPRQIFTWARQHFQRLGKWPTEDSGPILTAPGESWAAIDLALRRGKRGLPGGSSLAQLLAEQHVKRNLQRLSTLNAEQVLAWADAYFLAHGAWPYRDSGDIEGTDGETWQAVHKALQRGHRGLPYARSLANFLDQQRGIFRGRSRRAKRIPPDQVLHVDQIVAWGKAYCQDHGVWPNRDSGEIQGANGLKWSAVDAALKAGSRGLEGGSSLAKLLGGRYGPRSVPRLAEATRAP